MADEKGTLMETRRFLITAYMLMENLANKLYDCPGACLWEVVRNGVCACMPGDAWIPNKARVEVLLARDHPMNPGGSTLVVLDHGSGFTQKSLELWCNIGQSLEDMQGGAGSHAGASQKRIGRFAALALNRRCAEHRDPNAGFHIFTRTTPKGRVRRIGMIPAEIEKDQGIRLTEIDGDAPELGSLRGHVGSFTAVVIPEPVFETVDEIRAELAWFLPRKQDRTFNITVGGSPLPAPPLSDKVTHVQEDGGAIEAYLDRFDTSERTSGGIWLCDAETGLRVAHAPRLHSCLPSILCRHDLTGDIFIPGLLANQDTSRSSLTKEFVRSDAWKKAFLYLTAHVVPKAASLLDDTEVDTSPIDKLVRDIADQSLKIYGKPDPIPGPPWEWIVPPPPPPNPPGPPRGKLPGGKPPSGSDEEDEDEEDDPPPGPEPKIRRIKIGDKTYVLARLRLSELIWAEVDQVNPAVILINSGTYAAMPKEARAQGEHFLLMLLSAVARGEHPDDSLAAAEFVASHRRNFLRGCAI
ncbi:hypothetical protein A2856_00445 [Candidatus Uhrbacteria bacterium RIFCSPHIGHO2_01_FULL_63_20]|uniref:Histidine kinase/HSP90-like ATPase domain-containing protein n=1 Tax=Candidatus Uhrbacteria bacterium RIFCSPHIGHO2_01_FULL_63_20 TaxID=1802385 RepID=A0A1F7TLU4_9BACT|nr:MAG: hypothetical protein A2856_00445 [Candidatus Uhrbacteria bacterium RIFCSPHIGHO2_01_FULL_63_20]